MRQLLVYIYIVAITIGGSFYVGPLSIRVLLALLVTCLIIADGVNRKVQCQLPKEFIYLYVAFLFVMIMAQLLNGEIVVSGLLKDLFATHYISVLTFFIVDTYILTRKSTFMVTLVILSVTLLDALVTYLQYINSSVGWILGQMFFNVQDVKLDKIVETADQHSGQSLLNMSLAGGIFGDSVMNGYILSSFGILSLYFALKKTSYWLNSLGWLCIIIFICVAFMIQQRSAFVLLCAMVVWLTFRYLPKVSVAMVFIAVIYISLFGMIDIDDAKMGRFSNLKVDDTRVHIYSYAMDFIQNHILLGGPVTFNQRYGVYPHNFFFNAFIYGGGISALIVVYLYFKMLWIGFKTIIKNSDIITPDVVYAAGLIIFLLNGLTHNASLITGNATIWLLFAMMLRTNQLNQMKTGITFNNINL